MSEQTIDQVELTQKERFWYEHVQQAHDTNQSLSQYAQSQGLSLKCFYNYRSKLRKKGLLESSGTHSFIEVSPQRNDCGTLIMLPNGIRMQTQCPVLSLTDLIKRLL